MIALALLMFVAKHSSEGEGEALVPIQERMDSCRICYGSEDLLSPCDCSGSIKFICRECLEKTMTAARSKICRICRGEFNHDFEIPRPIIIHATPAPTTNDPPEFWRLVSQSTGRTFAEQVAEAHQGMRRNDELDDNQQRIMCCIISIY